ncbi:MAG: 50S ribosomal protein L23 [Elusimicrobiales bacterium]
MNGDIYTILKRPLQTEKSLELRDKENRYSFAVDKSATKTEIRAAVEKMFKVKVTKVHTSIVGGKIHRMGRFAGRRPDWKKAVVTLAQGQKIDTTPAA